MDPGNLGIVFLVGILTLISTVLYMRYQAVSNQLHDAELRVTNATKERKSMEVELKSTIEELHFAEKKTRVAEMKIENVARQLHGEIIPSNPN